MNTVFCSLGRFKKDIVISVLGGIVKSSDCRVLGFVVMADHVHALLRFHDDRNLPTTMKTWKRLSSHYLKLHYEQNNHELLRELKVTRNGRELTPFWQRRYYDFNIHSHQKLIEKIEYMHNNPVRAGITKNVADYKWSSAQWYFLGKDVGAPIDTDCI